MLATASQVLYPPNPWAYAGAVSSAAPSDYVYCCVPSGCRKFREEPIDTEDPGDAVRVTCTNPGCGLARFMHPDCYEDWQRQILFYYRCCETNATPRSQQLMIQMCQCICGHGCVTRLSSVPAKKAVVRLHNNPVTTSIQLLQQHARTSSFSSSTGSSSPRSSGTPPLSPPRGPLTTTSPPRTTINTPTTFYFPGGEAVTVPQHCARPHERQRSASAPNQLTLSRGNIFRHRCDLYGLCAVVPPAAQNPYNMRLDDDGPHGNDDIRSFVMKRLSAAGVREFSCVACRAAVPVYDEFPLVDGTFFLSPRSYDKSAAVQGADQSVEFGSAIGRCSTGNSARQVSVPFVYNRRLVYLNAVCLACLGSVRSENETGSEVKRPDPNLRMIRCQGCGQPWNYGKHLVIGTMYSYDVFACAPCCGARQTCTRCGGQPIGSGFETTGQRGSDGNGNGVEGPKFYSDYSRLVHCSRCGIEDYHYVRPFDEVFICTLAAGSPRPASATGSC